MLIMYYGQDWHALELIPFLLLGVFGGVYGAVFSKLNYRWCRDVRNKTWLQKYPIAEVLLVRSSICCTVQIHLELTLSPDHGNHGNAELREWLYPHERHRARLQPVRHVSPGLTKYPRGPLRA